MTLSFRYVTLCFHELWVEMGVYEAMSGEAASPHCFSLFLPKDINFWDPQQLEPGSLLQEKKKTESDVQCITYRFRPSWGLKYLRGSNYLPGPVWFHMCCLTQQHPWIVCQCWGPEQGCSFQAGLLGVPFSSLDPWGLTLAPWLMLFPVSHSSSFHLQTFL